MTIVSVWVRGLRKVVDPGQSFFSLSLVINSVLFIVHLYPQHSSQYMEECVKRDFFVVPTPQEESERCSSRRI